MHTKNSALNEAMITQLTEERDDPRRVASNLGQKAETVGAVSLLPARRQRPGRRPASAANVGLVRQESPDHEKHDGLPHNKARAWAEGRSHSGEPDRKQHPN